MARSSWQSPSRLCQADRNIMQNTALQNQRIHFANGNSMQLIIKQTILNERNLFGVPNGTRANET